VRWPSALVVGLLAALAAVAPGTSAASVAIEKPPEGTVVDRRIQDSRITESSGLAASLLHPGVLWTHNDSGDDPRIFAINPDGSTAATFTLPDAPARDWEAISSGRDADGRPVLWIGDIGDNLGVWRSVRVLKVREPEVLRDGALEWTRYDLAFADGPRNAEALLADPATGRLYVASKETSGAGLYAAPAPLVVGSRNTLQRVGDVPSVITDGAFTADGGRVALVDYVYAWVYRWTGDGLAPDPQRILLPARGQGESVAWTDDGSALLVGSEGVRSAIWRVPVREPSAPQSPTPGADPTSEPSAPPAAESEEGDGGQPPLWLWAAGALVAVVAGTVAVRSHRR
jgi:hypothetical protein